MKSLEFIYQDSEIHFLVNGSDKNVMINATEMAKAFGKKTEVFLKAEHAKAFIKCLSDEMEKEIILPPNGGRINQEMIISNRGRNGIYFHRLLALKFAAWLDPTFEVWIYSKIEEVIFGNYKKHWDAHSRQEAARITMQHLRSKLLSAPTAELAYQYFEAESEFKAAKNEKSNAIRNQLRLFSEIPDSPELDSFE